MKTNLAIVIVIANVLLSTFSFGCCCCGEPKTKAEQAADAKKAADQKIIDDALERKCGKPNSNLSSNCMDMVRGRLFQPSSASFSYVMGRTYDRNTDTCLERYGSTVTSKNAFGAEIEHRFQCSYNPKQSGRGVVLDFVVMN